MVNVMKYVVVDTNVPLKAANMHPENDLDRKCSHACLDFINDLVSSDDILVVDAGREILNEYSKKIDTHAEDNVATVFLTWVLRGILTNKVYQQQINRAENGAYLEFPSSETLKKFDKSDRKFVAVAKAHPNHPKIYNGSDTDWWIFKDALRCEGVEVVFLCEEYMRAKCK